MCGIVGATTQRPIAHLLVQGLQKLEYRGYDSSGLAVLDAHGTIQRQRCVGKVQSLAEQLEHSPSMGHIGIAHTRWATHGEPSEANAHPHLSGQDIAIVHNGIIENHQTLRAQLESAGYTFNSQTDSEVIAHLVAQAQYTGCSLREAVQQCVQQLEGAYGMVVMSAQEPGQLVVARSGSPLVIGLGQGENFVASDPLALLSETQRFIYLEEGDVAEVSAQGVLIFDQRQQTIERPIHHAELAQQSADKGDYQHFMQKEIYEQPTVLNQTLQGRLSGDRVLIESFGVHSQALLSKVEHIQIVACGTSYNAGLVAKYALESIAQVSCNVEIASEFRYRKFVTRPNSLLITLSQSGETADTLAALRLAKQQGFMSAMTICNVASSSMVRESDIAFMTEVGPEVGVASTKAFTSQLTALLMLNTAIARLQGRLSAEQEAEVVQALRALPTELKKTLNAVDAPVKQLAERFANKQHALFLGRGEYAAIAIEAALKVKEISYIHAEAYAAGELKHGPLALVDANMPVVVLAPSHALLDKVASNIEEVRARGGALMVFTDSDLFDETPGISVIKMPSVNALTGAILYTLPMQLLSYYVALVKGTNVDQPRNLAKSVTVE